MVGLAPPFYLTGIFKWLLKAKQYFKEDLLEMSRWDEKYSDVFIFMEHQGYVQYFFHTVQKDPDPTIYVSIEGKITTCGFRLLEFLLNVKLC
jgi:hypothetical protein